MEDTHERPRSTARPPPRSSSSVSFHHGRFLPGTVIAERYRIVGMLGVGGIGEVYGADDLELRHLIQELALTLFASLAFLLTRHGLVACIAPLFCLYSVFQLPKTIDTSVWYWDTSLYGIIAVVALAVYAFWISLGRQPRGGHSAPGLSEPISFT